MYYLHFWIATHPLEEGTLNLSTTPWSLAALAKCEAAKKTKVSQVNNIVLILVSLLIHMKMTEAEVWIKTKTTFPVNFSDEFPMLDFVTFTFSVIGVSELSSLLLHGCYDP